jgi:hypothetical protein
MIGTEHMPTEGEGNHDKGKHLAPVTHRLQGDQLSIRHGHPIVPKEGPVSTADSVEQPLVPLGALQKRPKNEVGVRIASVSRGPVQRGCGTGGMLQHDRDSIHPVGVAPVQGMEEDIDDGVNQR